jgi:phosphotriesterase-related protein
MTALGPIDPSELGVTLLHEHMYQNPGATPVYFHLPDDPFERKIAMQPLSLSNYGWARFNYVQHWDTNIVDDEEALMSDIELFKMAGGRTICNMSTRIAVHAPMRALSLKTGINIVSGSGYYVGSSHPPQMDQWGVEDVKQNIVSEFRDGKPGTDVRPGIIGEIGCTYPWGKNEKKVLQACARAMAETGLSLQVHPGRSPRQPQQILDILEAEGADLKRVAICHMDRTIDDMGLLKAVLDRGCTAGYDAFGLAWYPWAMEIPYPSDSMRIFQIKKLVDAGYVNQLYLSHDIDDKTTMSHYGGWGYVHILKNIVPMMRHHGISQEQIDSMLIENPKRLLTIV